MMMNTTSLIQNTNNPLVAPLQTQFQVFQMPQVNYMLPQVIPQQVNPPPFPYTMTNNVQIGTNIKMWDPVTQSIVELPSAFTPATQNNTYIPPQGYSFVVMTVPQFNTVQSVSRQGEPSPSMLSQSVTRSLSERTDEFLSQPPETFATSRQTTPEPTQTEPKRKYKHRSKQERIEQVHAEVQEKYTALGLYAGEDEVLRGWDTVRVHVKTYRGLNVIHQPLDMIMNSRAVQVKKIATPFSMKNKFQKKGFIVYLKLADASQVSVVQSIFQEYADYFPKCDVALTKEEKQRMEAEKAKQEEARKAERFNKAPMFKSQENFIEPESWADMMGPPAMKKQSSVSSIAA